MKAFILLSLSFLTCAFANAQSSVDNLPAGRYETVLKNNTDKWEKGDIILLDDNRYRISTSNEIGDYKFSVSAQRIFFTSGPLKSIYAKTTLNNASPTIVLPVPENEKLGLRLPAEVRGLYHQ
jgi:hypothetical protein